MKLLLDGVEVPWPAKVEIVVAPEGETAGPLLIECSGGKLTIHHDGTTAALTIIGRDNGGLILKGGDEPSTYRLGFFEEMIDAPVLREAGSHP